MRLDPNIAEMIHADKGEDTYWFLSRFVRNYLATSAHMRRRFAGPGAFQRQGMRYSSPEELTLFCGTEISANINDCQLPPMPQGNCFGNAFRLALGDRSLRYHEGWACMEGSIPTHHGWVVDAQGRVQDPTWLSVVRSPRDPGRVSSHNINRAVYLGVHVPIEHHISWFLSEGDVNLLARGEMTPPGLLERGMDLFSDYPALPLDDNVLSAVTKIMDATSQWAFDEATGIFMRDGQRWCGRRERFLADGEN